MNEKNESQRIGLENRLTPLKKKKNIEHVICSVTIIFPKPE